MRSLGLTPKNFKRPPKDGEQFEALVEQLLEAMGFMVVERPSRGADAGRDILVERVLKDKIGDVRQRVLVQCKHKAHSGKAVSDSDVGLFQNVMASFDATGYLLVTSTTVTEKINGLFRGFTRTQYPRWARFWNVSDLINLLNENVMVRDTFFPTGVRQALVGERIARSPFGLESLLKESKKRIFIAGQVLDHVTRRVNEGKYREMVFTGLEEGRRVEIMLCDPAAKYSVRAWESVVGAGYMEGLNRSVAVFRQWKAKAEKKRIDGLEIRKAVLVPLTITFVDPDDENGRLLFTPVVYEARADLRPCFLIVKKFQPYVFDYYWTAYINVFNDKVKTKDI